MTKESLIKRILPPLLLVAINTGLGLGVAKANSPAAQVEHGRDTKLTTSSASLRDSLSGVEKVVSGRAGFLADKTLAG